MLLREKMAGAPRVTPFLIKINLMFNLKHKTLMKTTKIKSFDLGHMHVEEDFGFQKMVSVEVEHLPYVDTPSAMPQN
ncbi:hypothetical protein [Prevotella sp. DNF00663]|uniref:hypothetical protein n=1 Tax=Prevotella sp. DNF00663 TaxID=1384078 RepID=UPI0012E39F44|nr:hypothetical protein [Prevotella sp. DNF00663]